MKLYSSKPPLSALHDRLQIEPCNYIPVSKNNIVFTVRIDMMKTCIIYVLTRLEPRAQGFSYTKPEPEPYVSLTTRPGFSGLGLAWLGWAGLKAWSPAFHNATLNYWNPLDLPWPPLWENYTGNGCPWQCICQWQSSALNCVNAFLHLWLFRWNLNCQRHSHNIWHCLIVTGGTLNRSSTIYFHCWLYSSVGSGCYSWCIFHVISRSRTVRSKTRQFDVTRVQLFSRITSIYLSLLENK